MPKITGWLYKEFPEKNTVYYTNLEPFKVKVRGSFGRYVHLQEVYRYYRNPRSGTSSYTIGGGTSTTNCYDFGSSISCNTSSNPSFTIPGTPSTPGGNIQENIDKIIDCKEKTFETLINNRGGKWESWKDTKLEDTFNLYCDQNIIEYKESPITKYSKAKKSSRRTNTIVD